MVWGFLEGFKDFRLGSYHDVMMRFGDFVYGLVRFIRLSNRVFKLL